MTLTHNLVEQEEYEVIMTQSEAKELTEDIKSTSSALYVLLKRAHDEKAWVAMGYKSWTEYIEAEFDFSRARSYQLINQARVIEEIEEVAGVDLYISEREARSIKKRLPEITQKIKEEVDDIESEEEIRKKTQEILSEELEDDTSEAPHHSVDNHKESFDDSDSHHYPEPEEEPLDNSYENIDYGEEGDFYIENLTRTLTIFEAMPDAENMAHISKQNGANIQELKELAKGAHTWIEVFLLGLEGK